jgi:ATP-binding cassette subfamily B (MDR/TAP) protein 1
MTSPLSNDTINNHHHPTNNNNNHIHPSLQEAVDDDDAVAASPLMTTTTNGNYHDHDDDDISKTTTTAKTTTGDSPIPNEPLKEDQEPSPPPPEQPQSDEEMASLQDTLKFVFDCGTSARIMFVLGCIAAIGNGMVYPIIAYVFSNSFTSVSSVSSNTGSNNGLAAIRKLAFTFLLVGVYGWIVGFLQFWLFHQIAHRASHAFQCQWFHALLRQDTAFYDVYDIGGLASQIGPNALLFRRGVGDKFGEGIQFFTTGVGGIAYAFYSSWRTALVVLCVVPFASLASRSVLTLNQSKSARAAEAYQTAGSVAYTTVAAIKTVLSLNAITKMIHDYHQATLQAYLKSISFLWKQGLANGCMLGSFMVLYAVVTLFGTYLMYRDIAQFGCDPSGGVHDNTTCQQSGPKVFGAMLGIGFAARGISQVGNFLETLSAARVATYPALQAIQRTPGAPAQILYNNKAKTIQVKEEGDDDHEEEEEHSTSRTIRALLPEYRIYPSSTDGLRPEHVQGTISLRNVSFSYPTRPQKPVLQEVSIDIAARTTVAIVGPR